MMDEYAIYRWPRGTPLFCLIALYALGFLMAAQSDLTHLFAGKAVIAVYFLVSTLFGLHLYRFRVILDATSIRTGAFVLKKMEFTEVVRARYVQGNDSGKIILFGRNGTRISVSETINDFGSFARAINSRLPRHLLVSRGGSKAPWDVLSGGDLV